MRSAPSLGVVIVAAGSGVRFGDAGKSLAILGDRPLLDWSLSVFVSIPDVHQIVVVAGEHTIERCQSRLSAMDVANAMVVRGGASRAESVRAGVGALVPAISHVVVHDAARPLLTTTLVERVVSVAVATGAAVPVVTVNDTLHEIAADGTIASTLDRSQLRAAQTPQVVRRDWLEDAWQNVPGTTDEGGLLHAAGYPVAIVNGDASNLKITWPEDLVLAEALLAARRSVR